VIREWWELLAQDDEKLEIPHARYSRCGVGLVDQLLPEAPACVPAVSMPSGLAWEE